VLAGCVAAAVAVLAFSPIIVRLLTLGVHNHVDAHSARNQCWVLLFLVIPQIGLYGIIGGSDGRPERTQPLARLAAAAPALETSA